MTELSKQLRQTAEWNRRKRERDHKAYDARYRVEANINHLRGLGFEVFTYTDLRRMCHNLHGIPILGELR